MQALFLGHSSFNIHSGLQPVYGSPWYSGKQVQMPSLQIAFEPHGDGKHGSVFGIIGSKNDSYTSALLYFALKIIIVIFL